MKYLMQAIFWVSIGLIAWTVFYAPLTLWIMIPAWLVLLVRICIWFGKIPSGHPIKNACYVMGIPILFGFRLWRSTFEAALNLIFNPASKWASQLVFSRSSLGLSLLYFAALSLFYARELERRQNGKAPFTSDNREGYPTYREM